MVAVVVVLLQAAQSSDSGDSSLLKQAWGMVMFLFLGWFALSIVESFAQQHQARVDEQTRAKLRRQWTKEIQQGGAAPGAVAGKADADAGTNGHAKED